MPGLRRVSGRSTGVEATGESELAYAIAWATSAIYAQARLMQWSGTYSVI
jgi:hypothetical protein